MDLAFQISNLQIINSNIKWKNKKTQLVAERKR